MANQAGWQVACVNGLIKGLEKPEALDTSLKDKLESVSATAKSNIPKAIQDLKKLYDK